MNVLDGFFDLFLLIGLGVPSFLPAKRDGTGKAVVIKLPMGAFSGSRFLLEARRLEVPDEFTNLSRHGRTLYVPCGKSNRTVLLLFRRLGDPQHHRFPQMWREDLEADREVFSAIVIRGAARDGNARDAGEVGGNGENV